MKKIGIIGSRRRNKRDDFKIVKKTFFEYYQKGDWIVSGGCPKGGDKFAEIIAKQNGIPMITFWAKWYDEFGTLDKKAGFKRNTSIAEYSDMLIACVSYDRKGGTEDTIKKFKKKNEHISSCFENLIILV